MIVLPPTKGLPYRPRFFAAALLPIRLNPSQRFQRLLGRYFVPQLGLQGMMRGRQRARVLKMIRDRRFEKEIVYSELWRTSTSSLAGNWQISNIQIWSLRNKIYHKICHAVTQITQWADLFPCFQGRLKMTVFGRPWNTVIIYTAVTVKGQLLPLVILLYRIHVSSAVFGVDIRQNTELEEPFVDSIKCVLRIIPSLVME